jgi:steroid delta-isomerase-like uncharacterized protein
MNRPPYSFGVGTGLVVALLLTACAPTVDPALEANKDLVRRFTTAVNDLNWEALDDLMTEDFTRHSAATSGPPVRSRDEFIALQQGFLASFPDQHVTIEQLVAEGDRVAILATYRGTLTGPLGDFPATGKTAASPFVAILRIESGRIAELWVEWDNLALLGQLGLFPPP